MQLQPAIYCGLALLKFSAVIGGDPEYVLTTGTSAYRAVAMSENPEGGGGGT